VFGEGGLRVVEASLPLAVMDKASLRGREYAWSLADVPEVVAAAREAGIATLGGQIQFRLPNGTCELYWRCADVGEQRTSEPWVEYVARSADEVLAGVRQLPVTELITEGLQWREVAALHAAGADVAEYLCFVLYFDGPDAEPGAAADRGNGVGLPGA
jgi:hypothetical protein